VDEEEEEEEEEKEEIIQIEEEMKQISHQSVFSIAPNRIWMKTERFHMFS
jgi:hypothetical protein